MKHFHFTSSDQKKNYDETIKSFHDSSKSVNSHFQHYDLSDLGSIDSNIFKNSLHNISGKNHDYYDHHTKFISLADVHDCGLSSRSKAKYSGEKEILGNQKDILCSGQSIISYNSIYLSSESDQQTIFTDNLECFEALLPRSDDSFHEHSNLYFASRQNEELKYQCFEKVSNCNSGEERKNIKSSFDSKYSSLPDFESGKLLNDYEKIDEKLRSNSISGHTFHLEHISNEESDTQVRLKSDHFEKIGEISSSNDCLPSNQNEINDSSGKTTIEITRKEEDMKTQDQENSTRSFNIYPELKKVDNSAQKKYDDFVSKNNNRNDEEKVFDKEERQSDSLNTNRMPNFEKQIITHMSGHDEILNENEKPKLAKKSSSFKMTRPINNNNRSERTLQKSYSTEQLYDSRKNTDKTLEEFLTKVNSIKNYWSGIFYKDLQDSHESPINSMTSDNDAAVQGGEKQFIANSFCSHEELSETPSKLKSDNYKEIDFDHVRYSILKSKMLDKNLLLKNPNTKSYENLVKYLQNYYSFQELLRNDNIVIIEPVKREFNKHSDTLLKSTSMKKNFFYQPICVNKELIEEELPDTGTVSNVRKMFEAENLSKKTVQRLHEAKSDSSTVETLSNWDLVSVSSELTCSAESTASCKRIPNDNFEHDFSNKCGVLQKSISGKFLLHFKYIITFKNRY